MEFYPCMLIVKEEDYLSTFFSLDY